MNLNMFKETNGGMSQIRYEQERYYDVTMIVNAYDDG
jgi:hypothetical protein